MERLALDRDEVRFATRSGDLYVRRDGGLMVLDLPAAPGEKCAPLGALVRGLRAEPSETYRASNYMAISENQDAVMALDPDLAALAELFPSGVIASAPGRAGDFVSRFFAPGHGIPEDPVTGSAHCTLVPYWSNRLGRQTLEAQRRASLQGSWHARCHRRARRPVYGR